MNLQIGYGNEGYCIVLLTGRSDLQRLQCSILHHPLGEIGGSLCSIHHDPCQVGIFAANNLPVHNVEILRRIPDLFARLSNANINTETITPRLLPEFYGSQLR